MNYTNKSLEVYNSIKCNEGKYKQKPKFKANTKKEVDEYMKVFKDGFTRGYIRAVNQFNTKNNKKTC